MNSFDIDNAVELLSASSNFRVLKKYSPRDRFLDDDGSEKMLMMVVDTETTGLDFNVDKVFEIGFMLIEVNESGKMFNIVKRYNGLQDPGFPLPDEIKNITGATDEEVKGQSFDDELIENAIDMADFLVAQNAGFDRRFLEKIFPKFRSKKWVCSINQGPWEEMGISIKKQEFLAYKVAGIFYDAHRALEDVGVLAEILAAPSVDGKSVMAYIMTKINQSTFKVWANNSPFESKDILKKNGYYWSDGSSQGTFKAWYKQNVIDPDQELDWLSNNVYAGKAKVTVDLILPEDSYSDRISERHSFEI